VLDREKSGRLSPEIFVYATNKNFLNIYDALRIDKVKVEVTGYDPASKRQTGHASAWLDRADARLLSHLVSHRLFAGVTGGKWEKFGGSQRDDGYIESRTLQVEWDEGDGGRFARNPYRLTIANGPGRKTDLGAVAPAGEPTARLSMRLTETDMIKVMLAVGAYITAYETAHHHRLVADKVRELDAKLAERATARDEAGARNLPAERPRISSPSQPQSRSQPEVPARAGSQEGPANYTPATSNRPALRAIDGGQASQPRASRAG
jgi:hypothetical protein